MRSLPLDVLDVISEFKGKYHFLSNFYYSPVVLDDRLYPTVEHAYQAAKTLDAYEREWIRNSLTPGIAKRRGRKVELRPDWEQAKVEIMEQLLRSKFENLGLAKKLKRTGDRLLVEGNRWGDEFWGIDLSTMHGENNLGLLLMKVRRTI